MIKKQLLKIVTSVFIGVIFFAVTPGVNAQAQPGPTATACRLKIDGVYRNLTKDSYTGGEIIQIAVAEDIGYSGNCSGFRVEIRVGPGTGTFGAIDWSAGIVIGTPRMTTCPAWLTSIGNGFGANCGVVTWTTNKFNSTTNTYAIRGVAGLGTSSGSTEAHSASFDINSNGGGQVIKSGRDLILSLNITNPLMGNNPNQNIFDVIFLITNWLLNIVGSLLVILIIYSGVRFMVSRGNPSQIQTAKNILKWALIGFAVILIGKGFIYLIDSILRGQIPGF